MTARFNRDRRPKLHVQQSDFWVGRTTAVYISFQDSMNSRNCKKKDIIHYAPGSRSLASIISLLLYAGVCEHSISWGKCRGQLSGVRMLRLVLF